MSETQPPAERMHDPATMVRAERVFRPPLVAFLLAVLSLLGYAAWARFWTPDVAEAVRWLADGDLDGAERRRALGAALQGALRSADPGDRWVGLLAAVALGDRPGYAAAKAPLGDGPVPSVAPPAPLREWLHLGDPLLGNVGRALLAEIEGDRAGAVRTWGQVRAQCRLVEAPFALELAEAALQRLR
ncbi:MAG: hypothetical protein FJ265_14655 [Planctomycetes bacterium]|nr:hypothetical protein [Planctomycetota bacterium]